MLNIDLISPGLKGVCDHKKSSREAVILSGVPVFGTESKDLLIQTCYRSYIRIRDELGSISTQSCFNGVSLGLILSTSI